MSTTITSHYVDLANLRKRVLDTKQRIARAIHECLTAGGVALSHLPSSSQGDKPMPANEQCTINATILVLENTNFDDFSLLKFDSIVRFSQIGKSRDRSPFVDQRDKIDDVVAKSDICLLQYMILRKEVSMGCRGKYSSKFDLSSLFAATQSIATRVLTQRHSRKADFAAKFYSIYRCLTEFEALVEGKTLTRSPSDDLIADVREAIASLVGLSGDVVAHLISNHHSGAQEILGPFTAIHWLCILSDRKAAGEFRKARLHLLMLLIRNEMSRHAGSGLHVDQIDGTATAGGWPSSMILFGRLAWLVRRIIPETDLVEACVPYMRAHVEWLSGEVEEILSASLRRSAHQFSSFGLICEAWFFATQTWMLVDEALNLESRLLLGVGYPVTDSRLTERSYPRGMQDFLQRSVIDKIRSGGNNRQTAFFSMLLYGPPGSAKTTFARKLAFDLGWPLLEIGQNDFMTEGRDRIESVSNKLFAYLWNLSDVVVLFDELEEMILERLDADDKDSRLMTASMLPRIQKLRESKRIVFIFATNNPDKVDVAIRRIGRFDIIKHVELPNANERIDFARSMSEALLKDRRRAQQSLESFIANRQTFVKMTKYMSYGDIEHYIRRLINADAAGGKVLDNIARVVFSEFVVPQGVKRIVDRCIRIRHQDRPGETAF
jgi:adenylate kinase family enzyme